MTTKERCLKALKDNEFFQSAMKKGKMICITHTYKPSYRWFHVPDEKVKDFAFKN